MARDPDPTIAVTSIKGVTRTLDDWTTMFHLAMVVLPARHEASAWVPVGRRIFATFGDADCHTAYCVTGNPGAGRRVLGSAADDAVVFVDPERALAQSLGLERVPAFVHLRQDTTLVDAAEGWQPGEWQRVADKLGKAMGWSVPQVLGRGDPAPTPGWPV